MELPNNNGTCIVLVLIYIRLLTTTHLHNKAAVVTKTFVNLFVEVYNFNTAGASIIILITHAGD